MYQEWQYVKLSYGRLVDSKTGVEANINWPSFLSDEAAEQYLFANGIRATLEPGGEAASNFNGGGMIKPARAALEYGYPNLNYPMPTSISEALQQSMAEEDLASKWYRQRATFARSQGDEVTAKLWEDIAEEEEGHQVRFKNRLDEGGY